MSKDAKSIDGISKISYWIQVDYSVQNILLHHIFCFSGSFYHDLNRSGPGVHLFQRQAFHLLSLSNVDYW